MIILADLIVFAIALRCGMYLRTRDFEGEISQQRASQLATGLAFVFSGITAVLSVVFPVSIDARTLERKMSSRVSLGVAAAAAILVAAAIEATLVFADVPRVVALPVSLATAGSLGFWIGYFARNP